MLLSNFEILKLHLIILRPSSAPLIRRKEMQFHSHTPSPRKIDSSTKSFLAKYQDLCRHYNLFPLSKVKCYLHENVLDLAADRIRFDDWKPLLEALQCDQGLQKIVIRSNYKGKVIETASTKEKVAHIRKCPVIFTAYGLSKLTEALLKCLCLNNCLVYLELQGIPLTLRHLDILLEGISRSKTLKQLSFIKIPLGDMGTGRICRALHKHPNVSSLNFTACGLTSAGVGNIANVIKAQRIQRFVEIWQQSLRYQRPNLDSMMGLRQITLNYNPLIGDEGLKLLLEGLEDDLWITGIEMNGCGIGIHGAMGLISFLKNGYAISVIDIRGNKNVPVHLIQHIMLLLAKKTTHYRSEYQWDSLPTTCQQPLKMPLFLSGAPEKTIHQQEATGRKDFKHNITTDKT
ncbi:centrosomal protein of 78 kDa-like [Ischnura elegans]|uniref:centrosomal protein of 78 kDa-like n=1 Tax=Ischnura elegans TaxID=197161 RepID=UPI001ED8B91B|nr:centrosomal protein of 78 kDa-like [Ischnura elegans]